MESKELGCKWNFLPKRKGEIGQSREDSSFAPFVEHKLRCLVREYIQNSMDVHSEKNPTGPIIVKIEKGSLNSSEYPELIQSLEHRLDACSVYCKSYPNGKDPYENKAEYLREHINSTIGFLKVSDYNTKGMPYIDDEDLTSPFRACVRESSASYKKSERAGGSHGLGKTVGFVNSKLNAVYYSTMDEDGNTFGEGIIKLCNHKLVDGYGVGTQYEATAFYDSCDGEKPNEGLAIPEDFRRNEPGTDAFVLGVEISDEDITTMKREVIRAFFDAINEDKLAVEICGEAINKSNLEEKMLTYFPDDTFGEFDKIRTQTPWIDFNPRPYYIEVLKKCGEDDEHIVLNTEIDFPGQFPLLGNATLKMWKSERIKESGARDSIVYMRDNSMVIEVKRGRNNKGYFGVCICDGVGSESLRIMENVTHDKWDSAELRDIAKPVRLKAEKTLSQLKDFIRACEEKEFPEEMDREVDILSLKRHRIGSSDNRNKESDEEAVWPTTNVTTGTKDSKTGESVVKILETHSGGKKKKNGKGKQTEPIPPVPPGPNPEPPGPKPFPPQPGPDDPVETPPSIPAVDGEGESEGKIYEDTPKGKHMKAIKLDGRNRRLIPLHDGEFACKLVIKVPQDFDGCKMVLSIQGVSGKMPLRLKRVSEGCKITGDFDNEIRGFDLKKDEANIIKFTPVENLKNYTLIIEAYGN